MRKGFILTLTTVALTLMVTSAVALGPTVENVPDVWITEQGDVDNVFRYSDALVLLDYIIPGVLGGEGSTSDSLYWTYALRDVITSGTELVGDGAFLAPASQHYQINTFAGEEPTTDPEVDLAAWVAEINGYTLESIADAGALDFYNIRLNLDALNPVPAADPVTGLPDYQAATLYVTDGATTPSTDEIIIATVADDIPDQLSSAGTPCVVNTDYTSLVSPDRWYYFGLLTGWMDDPALNPIAWDPDNPISPDTVGFGRIQAADVAFQNADCVVSAGSIAITSPVSQPTNRNGRLPGLLVLVGPAPVLVTQSYDSTTGEKRKAYRLKGTLETDQTTSGTNTLTLLSLNARGTVGASFGGYRQAGPSTGQPICATTYLVPTAEGDVSPQLIIYDDSAVEGGTVTATDLRIDSFTLTTMMDGVEQVSSGVSGDHTVSATPGAGVWTGFALNDGSGVTMDVVPAVASGDPDATNATLEVSATSAGPIVAPNGSGIFGFDGQFNTTPDRLLVVKATIDTTAADTAQIPTLRLTTLQLMDTVTPNYASFRINDFMLDRTLGVNDGTNEALGYLDADISTTVKDFYVIGETAGSGLLDTLWFAGYANQANATWNGDVRLHELTVSEFPLPLCPCD